MRGNLPNIGIIPDIVVDVASAKKASAEAQKRRAYAEEMGRKKAHSENAVKKYSELKESGGILAPEDQQKLQSAQSSIKMIDEFMKGLDRELHNHVQLAHLIERIRIAQSEPTVLEIEICLTKAVALERMRVLSWQERKEAEKVGKYPRNILFWGGKGYLPILETPANLALITEVRKLVRVVGEAKKIVTQEAIARMRRRADSLLHEMIVHGKEGIAYVYLSSAKLFDGKQLGEGHLLLQLVKNEQGAKIICLEAYGRVAQKYQELRRRKRFLPVIFVKAGKITSYLGDKELFDDMRVFLRDVIEGLRYEKSLEAIADTLVAAALSSMGSLP